MDTASGRICWEVFSPLSASHFMRLFSPCLEACDFLSRPPKMTQLQIAKREKKNSQSPKNFSVPHAQNGRRPSRPAWPSLSVNFSLGPGGVFECFVLLSMLPHTPLPIHYWLGHRSFNNNKSFVRTNHCTNKAQDCEKSEESRLLSAQLKVPMIKVINEILSIFSVLPIRHYFRSLYFSHLLSW